jgi:putative ABC transport system permease protein
MKIFNLAWRNVFRHTRRSVITAIAISVGLAAMITMNSMMNGVDKMAEENIVNYEAGQISIFAKGYYREEGLYALDSLIENPSALMSQLKTIRSVQELTPRLKFLCQINTGLDELSVLGIGIDVNQDQKVFKIKQTVVKGHYLENREDLLIGEGLAKEMKLELGAMVTMITKDKFGTYNAYDLIVAGLFNTGHPLIDRNAAIISLDLAQELLNMENQVTEIGIRTNNKDLSILKQEITDKIGNDYEEYTWKELYASIFEVSSMKRSVQFMVALAVVIIAAVGIINTMLMAVMERTNEIGTLKAMGFMNSKIIKMFVYEGGIIGFFGSVIGCFIGILLSFYLKYVGIDVSSRFEAIDIMYPIKFILKGEIDYKMILLVFLFGIAISILVTLYPVRRATRLKPADALRKT